MLMLGEPKLARVCNLVQLHSLKACWSSTDRAVVELNTFYKLSNCTSSSYILFQLCAEYQRFLCPAVVS